MEKAEIFQGNRIEVLEMVLKNAVYQITFFNVSRFRIGEVSAPLEIHGFEMVDHSQNGWEKDSTYEIRDFEDDRVGFFGECFKMTE